MWSPTIWRKAGLLPYLEKLGFGVTAYGCTTCIGNAGDLAPEINEAITTNDLVCAAVLSGNRNFEARIHPNLKANFLASPPLVVAYAIAGTVLKDLTTEPLGTGKDGPVFLKDIWPSSHEIAAVMSFARDPATFRKLYGDLANANPLWKEIAGENGQVYGWPRLDLHREAAVLRRLQHDDRARSATSRARARSASSATR